MVVRDQNVAKNAYHAWQWVPLALVVATGQTGVNAQVFSPGYAFRVRAIKTYNLLKAGAVSGNLKVGPVAGTLRTAAALVFTSATEVAATLSTSLANLLGKSTEQIVLQYTTDGAGALTNGFVSVAITPWPLNGELGQTTP